MVRNVISSLITGRRAIAIVVAVVVCGALALHFAHSGAQADPPAAAPPVTPVLVAPVKTGAAGAANAPPTPPPPAAAPVSNEAHIIFTTVPGAFATVTWGKKVLGRIAPRAALVVVRPRDSGPLDVVVRAAGYMPVQVRAHTFSDTRVAVKLTTLEQKPTLLGYRLPIDAGPEAGEPVPPPSDAGMPLLP